MHENTEYSIDSLRQSILEHFEATRPVIVLQESSIQEHIGTMSPIVAFDDSNRDELLQSIKYEFDARFVDTFLREQAEEIDYTQLARLTALVETYAAIAEGEAVEEAGKMRELMRKGDRGARKIVHGIRKRGHESKRVAVVAKKIPSYFTNLVGSTMDRVAKMDSDERKRRILEGSFRFKLFKIIRTAILSGAAWAVNPALGVITLIASVARHAGLDAQARKTLIQELQTELSVTTEKIRDADQKGETQKKYQLMRIRDRLNHDLQRIQFSLKGDKTSSKRY